MPIIHDDLLDTDHDIDTLESEGKCPNCGGDLDSGAGFGKRDLECSECFWNISYDIDIYLARIRSDD